MRRAIRTAQRPAGTQASGLDRDHNNTMSSTALPRQSLLATALSFAFAATALHAQDLTSAASGATVASVTVSASRFPDQPGVGATVITADEIRRAGAANVNQAIRKIGGVYGRQSLDGSPDFALDLRGFGSNSSENVVVMLDGVRLSENELGGAVLSTIPIETVERIEIIRGGASVLFGEGATGGVIQIVTKKPTTSGQHGSVFAELGQFKSRDLRMSAAKSWDGFSLDASVAHQGTDNYRQNNHFQQNAFSGGAQWAYNGGRFGLRIDAARSDSGLPGSLTQAQFEADPRKSFTLNDHGSLDADRQTAFIEHHIGQLELAAELSHREKTVKSTYFFDFGSGPFASNAAYDSRQNQFSPRLRYVSPLQGMQNQLVAGVDWIRWNRKTESDFSTADATQTSKAVYVRDELRLAGGARVSAGARHETFDKEFSDPLSFSLPKPESSGQSHNAWELQGSYPVVANAEVYAKFGQSYRVPNADENSFRSSVQVLKIQTSHDIEIGTTLGDSNAQVTARVFRHNLENEIFFDPKLNFGTNTNLDPTRRQGVEFDGEMQVAQAWRISGHAQHVKATFREGANAGREMVLVPKNVVTARLAWVPGDGQTADFGAQWVDSQRYGDDFKNSCSARIPSFTTLDARYARTFGAWEFAVSGQNLADKKYYSNAFSCRGGIYPSDGRQLKVSLRYDFK